MAAAVKTVSMTDLAHPIVRATQGLLRLNPIAWQLITVPLAMADVHTIVLILALVHRLVHVMLATNHREITAIQSTIAQSQMEVARSFVFLTGLVFHIAVVPVDLHCHLMRSPAVSATNTVVWILSSFLTPHQHWESTTGI